MPDFNFPHSRAVLEEGISQRLHLGAQLYVSLRGQVLADLAVGESRPGAAMATNTINLWLSSGKPITAVAIAQLWERRLIELDDTVARYIPEFGVRGKEPITIRQVLTHTGGFRAAPGLMARDSFEDALDKVCRAPLEPRWVPGETAGYHPTTGWYVLAGIVQRIDGRPYEQYAREEVLLPLQITDSWVGVPPQAYHDYGQRMGVIFEGSAGALKPAARGNSAKDAAVVNPGANVRGPLRELGMFYESLYRLLHGQSNGVLRPQTVSAMTARQRTGAYDLTFKHVMDWGLGFIVNSSQYGVETVPYGYGERASPQTFGHGGQESSCGFCDPLRGVVVAWMCNGMPGAARAAERHRKINRAIEDDLAALCPAINEMAHRFIRSGILVRAKPRW